MFKIDFDKITDLLFYSIVGILILLLLVITLILDFSLFVLFSLTLIFFSLFIYMFHRNNTGLKKCLKFLFFSIFLISLCLSIEHIFNYISSIDKLIKISGIYIITAFILSTFLKDYSKNIDFELIIASTTLTLVIHLVLIIMFPEIPILFFRMFGLILDVYLLITISEFYEFYYSVNNFYFRFSKNIINKND